MNPMNKSRANYLKKLALFSAVGATCLASFSQGQKIVDAAQGVHINFGTAIGQSPSRVNFSDILAEEFNMLVCENQMKFQPTEPSQGQFSYSGGDAVVDFAESNGQLMRGHTLVWHSQTSNWMSSINNRNQMLSAMKNHIDNVLGHWEGQILEWDVVNEAVADNGRELRSSFYRNVIGEDFLDSAFVYAHAADPEALLYYNDYGAEGGNAKSNFVYEMVGRMLEDGIPIHGVGLQCHLGTNLSKQAISDNIKRLGELGLRVSLTEIDISNATNNGNAWKNLAEACAENFNCTSFMTWGVHDGISWKGSGCGCLIWNSNLSAKQAPYNALVEAFENADPDVAAQRLAFINGDDPNSVTRHYKKFKNHFFNFANNQFNFKLKSQQQVKLSIVDPNGKVTQVIDLGMKDAGAHAVPWQNEIPAGMYIANLKVGEQSVTLPLTQLK